VYNRFEFWEWHVGHIFGRTIRKRVGSYMLSAFQVLSFGDTFGQLTFMNIYKHLQLLLLYAWVGGGGDSICD
jgi:hypothetical protein